MEALNFSRRQMLKSSACGFGYMALAGLSAEAALKSQSPLMSKTPHFEPRAKRVIFLFMHGGPSHVDTFDYKPRLNKEDGQRLPFKAAKNIEKSSQENLRLMKSPWKFKQRGDSGLWISELFENVAEHADDLCVINSMHTNGQSHGQAVMKLHTGSDSLVRPSVGSWMVYGLGTENNNLPGFISICPSRGHGGVRNYGSAFLPAVYQGTAIGDADTAAKEAQIRFLDNNGASVSQQRKQLGLLQAMNERHLTQVKVDNEIEGVINSYELAFRMQSEVPALMDLNSETKETQALYGIDDKTTENFGRQCLMARRFAEAGVRYIEVALGNNKWDQHSGLKNGHERNSKMVDKPIAGLLADLKQRGLLEDTLVVWGGEFGRTPIAQGKNGRDHNPQGYSMWLAGAGVKKGHVHGATDEYGYYATRDKVHIHDLHATLLHLMGMDHKRLTYRYAGRDFRLTDVYGDVVTEILNG
ncbi:MAG: sulfatase [Gimesia sp.]|nr:sulfatase [Gimesia sp.]|tara:strand:+ start:38298 stop:39707 length:1410 start_codon:yes stop_codon:yes gene_type:complete